VHARTTQLPCTASDAYCASARVSERCKICRLVVSLPAGGATARTAADAGPLLTPVDTHCSLAWCHGTPRACPPARAALEDGSTPEVLLQDALLGEVVLSLLMAAAAAAAAAKVSHQAPVSCRFHHFLLPISEAFFVNPNRPSIHPSVNRSSSSSSCSIRECPRHHHHHHHHQRQAYDAFVDRPSATTHAAFRAQRMVLGARTRPGKRPLLLIDPSFFEQQQQQCDLHQLPDSSSCVSHSRRCAAAQTDSHRAVASELSQAGR